MHPSNDLNRNEIPKETAELNGQSHISPNQKSDSNREKRMHAIPKCGSLEGVTEICGSLQGVELATLVPYDTIAVHTINSDYRIFLLDPETGRALLEGGSITEPVEARVFGSSFGGSMLRTGWIGVGLRMEACANDKYVRTSPVQSLCVSR
ncbi:MAG: hypothetical protein ND866_22520 [Pyrinomonadaceae bacterium]|nr:hypothetical protein [Pyrinomonadaceae bacterium]